MAFLSGTKLGSYEVVAQIGAGGMGEVYRARDGKRFAVLKTPGEEKDAAVNHVNFVVNFFDKIRRLTAPQAK